MSKQYAQGDVLLVEINPLQGRPSFKPEEISSDSDGMMVLARGEKHGHRHGFWDSVAMFHDEALARDIVVVAKPTLLVQDAGDPAFPPDHGPVDVPPGTYEVRQQRKLEITAPNESEIRQALD